MPAGKKIRIACVGNSITYGAGIENREKNSYPAQLQALLGDHYEVGNFGVNGRTLLNKGNLPYRETAEYKAALAFQPDIVFIKLGTNDSKLINRVHMDEFGRDYHGLIASFAGLASHPRIILLEPVPSYSGDTAQIWDPVLVNQIIPAIRQVAYDERLECINLYNLLIGKPELFPDEIHPNAAGAGVIAKRLAVTVLAKRDTAFNIFDRIGVLPGGTSLSSFYGYACTDFNFDTRACKIVRPRWTAPGHPWVWRARFWGHEPQTDIALLERGFHIVYCDVAELFGNAEAIGHWNKFYALLRAGGLSARVALEGMSRGGVYIYNWAAVNPDKVACIYADNPVLDLKSWPGGRSNGPDGKGRGPGSAADWELFKKDYGYTSDAGAMKFAGSPIDKIRAIVKGGYPMLHVCGDADEVVPMEENTIPFEKKVKALGGNITVIHKPGLGHHPHSLPDPSPIVDFIVKACL